MNTFETDMKLLELVAADDLINLIEILKKPHDIHVFDDGALCCAVLHGYNKIVKVLIEDGADVNALRGYPLNWAIETGNFEIAKLLIENGADISIAKVTEKNGKIYNYIQAIRDLTN